MPSRYAAFTHVAILSGVVALALVTTPSHAAVTTYTDLASWQAAVGASPTFVEGFDGFVSDTSFVSVPVVSGPLTLSHMGPGNFREIIDVLPLANTDNGFINTTAVSAFTNFGLETVQMGFAAPIYAWAAEFGGGSDGGEGLDIAFTNQFGTTIVQETVNNGFFGFVTTPDEQFSSIQFQSRINNPSAGTGESFYMDDVRGASAVVAVPETSTFLLALPTLMTGILVIKRRKNA